MQIHGMQRPYTRWAEEHFRLGYEDRDPEKDETNCKEETGELLLQSYLISLLVIMTL